MRLATWNINSVRLRAGQVQRFVREAGIDVLLLQETKCREAEFPYAAMAEAGLGHVRVAGQKGWHGVAVASRLPLSDADGPTPCREGHARCLTVRLGDVRIVNLYIPAGGDVADRALNPKFDHKLDFYERLTHTLEAQRDEGPLLLAGDFNVAPGEWDVWSHRQMSRVVSHTPIEVEAAERLRQSRDFVDLPRRDRPEPEKLATWWSYRAADPFASNRGLRLDHLWATPSLAAAASHTRIHAEVRRWERPSDHVPVSVDLDV